MNSAELTHHQVEEGEIADTEGRDNGKTRPQRYSPPPTPTNGCVSAQPSPMPPLLVRSATDQIAAAQVVTTSFAPTNPPATTHPPATTQSDTVSRLFTDTMWVSLRTWEERVHQYEGEEDNAFRRRESPQPMSAAHRAICRLRTRMAKAKVNDIQSRLYRPSKYTDRMVANAERQKAAVVADCRALEQSLLQACRSLAEVRATLEPLLPSPQPPSSQQQ